jgi:hypothetical protein
VREETTDEKEEPMAAITQSDVLRTGFPGAVLPANTWVTVDAGYDLTRFRNKLLSVKNVGANLIGDGAVQGTTVPPAKRVETDWLDVDPMVFANLAAGAMARLAGSVVEPAAPTMLIPAGPRLCQPPRSGEVRHAALIESFSDQRPSA